MNPAQDSADFDLGSCPIPRFDEPAPVQLETRGATRQTPEPPEPSNSAARQGEFWHKQTAHKFATAAKLREAGRPDLAAKLEDCHSRFTVSLCSACGRVDKFPNRCDLFYCPECQPRLARDRRESVEWWARETHQPKHVVLTLRNVFDLSPGHVHELKHCFAKLRHRRFAKNWLGGFYGIEVTNERKGWHLHLHALINAKWIDAGELARQWASVTNGFGLIVKVKDCRSKDYLAEVTKYAVKGSQLAAWPANQVREFVEAFDGVRTFGVFGSLYGKRTEFADWLKSLRDHKPACPCGCATLRYFTETEWLMRDLDPARPAAARPPPAPQHPEFALDDHRHYVHD